MRSDTVTLAAVGDISFHGAPEKSIREKGASGFFRDVAASLSKADIRFGNQESVLLDRRFPSARIRANALSSSDIAAGSLVEAGFDVMSAASNHSLDCGRAGLKSTVRVLESAGIVPVGAGSVSGKLRSPHVVKVKDERLGFLSYLESNNCTHESAPDMISYFRGEETFEEVRRASEKVDCLVVSLHADMEFQPAPSMFKVDICRKLASAGAGLVLCHHPHVPQGVEKHGNSLIAYSLGNFAFDICPYQRGGSPQVFRSQILFVEIKNGRPAAWRREHFRITPEGRPCRISPAARASAEKYNRHLDSMVASDELLREAWHRSSMNYLRIYWKKLVGMGPEDFIRNNGWRILTLDEHKHWTTGILDLARIRRERLKKLDFEFKRPDSKFGH